MIVTDICNYFCEGFLLKRGANVVYVDRTIDTE